MLAILVSVIQAWSAHAQDAGEGIPGLTPDGEGVLFSIGELDASNLDFEEDGWEGVADFECTVGIDCDTEKFPMRLHAPSAYYWDYKAVQRATIRFRLAEDLRTARVTLSRAGDETSVLQIDDEGQFTVTGAMLGSSGGGRYGQVTLELGPLEAGLHRLLLSVADDDEGNGRHALDAIILEGTAE